MRKWTMILIALALTGVAWAQTQKAPHWKAQVTGQQVLKSIPDQPDVSGSRPVLALKVEVTYTGEGDAILAQGQIGLISPSGKPCLFFAFGSGNGDFSQFNFYAGKDGWFSPGYPKIDYAEKDGEAPVFGLKKPDAKKPHVLRMYSKRQMILLGFFIPPAGSSFRLRIGDAPPVALTVR